MCGLQWLLELMNKYTRNQMHRFHISLHHEELMEYLYLSNAIPHVGNYTFIVNQQYRSSHPTDLLHGKQKQDLIYNLHV